MAASKLLGIGCPLVEMYVEVRENFLTRHNVELRKTDTVYELTMETPATDLQEMNMYNEMYTMIYQSKTKKKKFIVGGQTQSALRYAQWCLQHNGKATFMGSVGNDKFYEAMKKNVKDAGIEVHYHEENVKTGTSGAFLVKGQIRDVIKNFSAGLLFDMRGCDTCEYHLKNSEYYYCGGDLIAASAPRMISLARHANENQKVFIMQVPPVYTIRSIDGILPELFKYANYVFAMDFEANQLNKIHNFTEDKKDGDQKDEKDGDQEDKKDGDQEDKKDGDQEDKKDGDQKDKKDGDQKDEIDGDRIQKIALGICNLGSNHAMIIIIGKQKIVVAHNGETESFDVPVVDKVSDLLGEDSAFIGGFLSQLVQNKPIKDCVRVGSATRKICQERQGTTLPDKTPIMYGIQV